MSEGFFGSVRRNWPAVALPLVVVGIALVGSRLIVVETSQLVDVAAPGFALPVAAGPGASEGDRIALEGLRGRVVLLDFWATWCPPCRQSIPILNRIHEQNESRGVSVVGINVEPQLSLPVLMSAHRTFGATFPSVQDTRANEVQRAYSVDSLPTLVLVGPDGVVRHVESGVPDEQELQERIDSLLE